jgi:hypothetical protein
MAINPHPYAIAHKGVALNPQGAFKVCAFDDCAKPKSPLGDLGVIEDDADTHLLFKQQV